MNYYTFLPGFHTPIRQRVKRSTIRGKAKVRVGDQFALRYWTGRPYGSPMGFLGTATCLYVCEIKISPDGFHLHMHLGEACPVPLELDGFSRCEGFTDWAHLRAWFTEKHRIDRKPLSGVLTYWGETFEANHQGILDSSAETTGSKTDQTAGANPAPSTH